MKTSIYGRLFMFFAMGIILSRCAKQSVFTQPPDGPVIDSIRPASGTIGTQVRLYGSGFSLLTTGDTVSINGVSVRTDAPSSVTVLLVTLLDSTGTGPVHIKVGDRSSDGPVFTYTGNPAGPVITDIRSGDGEYIFAAGDTLVISGNNFVNGNLPSTLDITYNGAALSPAPQLLSWTGTQIKAIMPAYAIPIDTFVSISVKAGNLESAAQSCKYAGVVTALIYLVAGSDQGSAEGTGSDAQFNGPAGMAFNLSDVLFVADAGNNRIRSITLSGTSEIGIVTTLCGSSAGFADGSLSVAKFNSPEDVGIDPAGNLYIADLENGSVRKINMATNTVSSLGPVGGSEVYQHPIGIAVDQGGVLTSGNVYVSDRDFNRVYKVPSTEGGQISIVAGNGTAGDVDGTWSSAEFSSPFGLALHKANTLYVADANNHVIRLVNINEDPAITSVPFVTSPVGSGTNGNLDGTVESAQFSSPVRMVVDPNNNMYVADLTNRHIRKVDPNGNVSTIVARYADGSGIAYFIRPDGIALDHAGDIYVADAGSNRIYRLKLL